MGSSSFYHVAACRAVFSWGGGGYEVKQTRLLRLELNEVPPREFRIFPYGVIETTKGIFIFDERAAEQVMAA